MLCRLPLPRLRSQRQMPRRARTTRSSPRAQRTVGLPSRRVRTRPQLQSRKAPRRARARMPAQATLSKRMSTNLNPALLQHRRRVHLHLRQAQLCPPLQPRRVRFTLMHNRIRLALLLGRTRSPSSKHLLNMCLCMYSRHRLLPQPLSPTCPPLSNMPLCRRTRHLQFSPPPPSMCQYKPARLLCSLARRRPPSCLVPIACTAGTRLCLRLAPQLLWRARRAFGPKSTRCELDCCLRWLVSCLFPFAFRHAFIS